jgi:hypothetical protein
MKSVIVMALTTVAAMVGQAQTALPSSQSRVGADNNPFSPNWATNKDRDQLESSLGVQSISVGPQAQAGSVRVDVKVRNFSGKTITDHWGFVTARYADGKEVSQIWNEDLLMDTVLTRIPGTTVQSPKTLRNGETRSLTVLLSPGSDGSAPISVSGHPSALLFEDRTALGNAAQISMTLQLRRAQAEDLLDVVERLRAIRTHPNVLAAIRTNANPVTAVRAAFSEQIGKPRTGAVPEQRSTFRETMLQELAKTILLPGLDMPMNVLDSMIQMEQATQDATSQHSILREVK